MNISRFKLEATIFNEFVLQHGHNSIDSAWFAFSEDDVSSKVILINHFTHLPHEFLISHIRDTALAIEESF